jgi:hypothetical protein
MLYATFWVIRLASVCSLNTNVSEQCLFHLLRGLVDWGRGYGATTPSHLGL